LPDTFGGALALIAVNATVVFLALAGLSLIIRVTHGILSKFGSKDENDGSKARQEEFAVLTGFLPDESSEDIEGYPDTAERHSTHAISEEVQAAIAAALEAYMSPREAVATPVFLRRTNGSGAWGRMARYRLCARGPGSSWKRGWPANERASNPAGQGRCHGSWM